MAFRAKRANEHPFDIAEFLIYLHSLWLFSIHNMQCFFVCLPYNRHSPSPSPLLAYLFLFISRKFLFLSRYFLRPFFSRYIIAATIFSRRVARAKMYRIIKCDKWERWEKCKGGKRDRDSMCVERHRNSGAKCEKSREKKTLFELNLLSLFISKQYYIGEYTEFFAPHFLTCVKCRCCLFSFGSFLIQQFLPANVATPTRCTHSLQE